MTTAADVAAWMVAELERQGVLHQDDAVGRIADTFGQGFTYDNEAGNPAISHAILAVFNKLTRKNVVWSRGERYWRPREAGDDPSRMQP